MSKRRKDKIGKGVLVRGVVICIAVAAISISLISGLAAQGTGDAVTVTVNAPEMAKAGDTFVASIDVDSIANFNSGQFDLSFDASVVNVTGVESGCINETVIPIGKDKWRFMDNHTIRVLPEVPGTIGVSGSGDLAAISFTVVGKGGDKSILDISNGILYNNEAEKIPAEWMDDEVIVGPVKVEVNAPEMAKAGGTFIASVDVDSIADFNAGLFDLSFDASVVNVTEVANGSLDGETIPVDRWEFVDNNTIRVFLEVPGITGVSGAGNLATISFDVVGMGGDRSVLDISDDGMLGNTEGEEIPTEWMDDKVIVGPVKVEVNAPKMAKAGGTFVASIDVVDSIADFNAGLFDLSFDSSVVNITDVANGSFNGETIPVDKWECVDNNTIRVFLDVPGIAGVSGAGNLATISFEVVGKGGDRSVLDISNGMLGNKEAEEIPTEWTDDKVIVGPVKVEVNAPEMAKAGETFIASIDVVDSIADFNAGLFDLSFDSSVVNITDVANGSFNGETIPVDKWECVDNNTIRVFLDVPGIAGVSGAGNLATIRFEVVGKGGDRSVLDISNGMLGNTEAEEIPTEWTDDKVIVGPVKVEVNAPEMVKAGETFVATVDVVDSVANLNIAQFDLSFNSSVVNVTGVTNGSIDGTEIPGEWEFVDSETIRVISELPEEVGVSGSGYLATISFAAKGKEGDESVLKIANGTLANNIAEEIPAEWIEDKVTLVIE